MRLVSWTLVLALATAPAWGGSAPGPADREELDFFCGRYDLVGQLPEGGALYAGEVEVWRQGDQLRLRRTLRPAPLGGGAARSPELRSEGTARLERRTADRIRVLVAEFREAGEEREAWCAIGTGLDNDPRLTCRVRVRGTAPASPGLEAWFFRPPTS